MEVEKVEGEWKEARKEVMMRTGVVDFGNLRFREVEEGCG